MKKNRQKTIDAFDAYVRHYDIMNSMILLKYRHTLRVADLSFEIAQNLEGVDAELAWMIGILHDIGRFYQVEKYATFVDEKSVDHADKGADLLFLEGEIQYFIDGLNYSEEELEIIECSIRNHNKYSIENGLDDKKLEYCRILRDADKIDIFHADCEAGLESVFGFSKEEITNSPISLYVKNCFMNGKTVFNKEKKFPADYIAAHICLIYDLYYPTSLYLVKTQGYLKQLLDLKFKNDETQAFFDFMKEKIQLTKL